MVIVKEEFRRYRKKPLVVEALKITESLFELYTNGAYYLNKQVRCFKGKKGSSYVLIETLEGTMKGYIGDYIVRGIKGELYPCREDIFKETYETFKLPNLTPRIKTDNQ